MVDEREHWQITMPDGVRLSARLWLPRTSTPSAAVLEAIPYRWRDGTIARDELMHPFMAERGFACVRLDLRGCGESQGLLDDEYTAAELDDILHVIACIAAQPWCSGRVGVMGKSWGAFNALQLAALQPPALAAVVSVMAATDRFDGDIHFKGGVLLGENFGWAAVMLSYQTRPADPQLNPDWRDDWLRRLAHNPWLAPRWASHQTCDAFWQHGSVCEDFGRLRVPILTVGGLSDGYINAVDELVRHAPAAKGLIGPWVHLYPHQGVPGPAIGFLQMMAQFWNRHLNGVASEPPEPALRLFVARSQPPDECRGTRAGFWLSLDAWPSPHASSVTLGLGADGRLGPSDLVSVRVSTPQHLGLTSGEFFPMTADEMAGDQASDDALSVCFDGAPLLAPLFLAGRARVKLSLSSDRALAFVVARLCDVDEQGRSLRLAHGMLNLCRLDGAQDVELELDFCSAEVAAGHKLRLALSTTYWPFAWPSPVAATLTVTRGSLRLPLLDVGQCERWQPPEPVTAPGWQHRVLRAPSVRRVVEHERDAGTRALVIETDEGAVESLAHGLCTSESVTERWQIGAEPLSAAVTHVWEQALWRGAWRVRTRVWAQMTSTPTHLVMRAHVTAWEGELAVFERAFDDELQSLVERHQV